MDGLGLLLPKEALSSLVMVQRSLSEHGITLINEPFAHIDPVRLELVVLEPRVSLDEAAVSHLRTLTAGPPESAPASPGRYALRYWLHGVGGEGSEELSQGAAVARSLGAVVAEPGELADLVDPITRLVAATRVEVVPIDGPTELIHRIRNWRRVA